MTALCILAGIIWIMWVLCKESSTKQVPMDSDFIQANNDYYSGKYSIKEINKKLQNGDYVKKK